MVNLTLTVKSRGKVDSVKDKPYEKLTRVKSSDKDLTWYNHLRHNLSLLTRRFVISGDRSTWKLYSWRKNVQWNERHDITFEARDRLLFHCGCSGLGPDQWKRASRCKEHKLVSNFMIAWRQKIAIISLPETDVPSQPVVSDVTNSSLTIAWEKVEGDFCVS